MYSRRAAAAVRPHRQLEERAREAPAPAPETELPPVRVPAQGERHAPRGQRGPQRRVVREGEHEGALGHAGQRAVDVGGGVAPLRGRGIPRPDHHEAAPVPVHDRAAVDQQRERQGLQAPPQVPPARVHLVITGDGEHAQRRLESGERRRVALGVAGEVVHQVAGHRDEVGPRGAHAVRHAGEEAARRMGPHVQVGDLRHDQAVQARREGPEPSRRCDGSPGGGCRRIPPARRAPAPRPRPRGRRAPRRRPRRTAGRAGRPRASAAPGAARRTARTTSAGTRATAPARPGRSAAPA